MTTRDTVTSIAMGANGYLDGAGYDTRNRYSTELGYPVEAWCGDFVTCMFREAGVPLPSMQLGHVTGFSYCPAAVQFGRVNGAVVNSWQAQPADVALFDWNGDGVADHTELVIGWAAGTLQTIGGNSGPSNVDAHRGKGGVHRHAWTAPAGRGNSEVLAVLSAAKLVPALAPGNQPTPKAPAFPGRVLMLKSPAMGGADVRQWQAQMVARGWTLAVDGVYGPVSAQTCRAFQIEKRIGVDGRVGPVTWAAAWSSPVTR